MSTAKDKEKVYKDSIEPANKHLNEFVEHIKSYQQ